MTISDSYADIAQHLGECTLLGVSKKKSIEAIQEAYNCGIRHFGENYLQEASAKIERLKDYSLCWHFIGGLQTNKIAKIVELFDVIQSLDSEKHLHEIEKRAALLEKTQLVMIQLNMGKEEQKSGTSLEGARELSVLCDSLENVRLIGYMVVTPREDEPAPYFEAAYTFFSEMKEKYDSITELSMGMSNDYKSAIACGATIVRIGTALFGSRD